MPRQGHEQDSNRKMHSAAAPGASGVGVIDPVCGMTVDPHTAKQRTDYQGHTYYFCCAGCRTKFIADPQAMVPANRMPYAGMANASDRADLIAYLQKASR